MGAGNDSSREFEIWRKTQIASLIRSGYPDAAKAFERLGSVQWAGWMAAWDKSRESLVIELPDHFDKYESGDFMYWAEDVEKAIHAAGVKTK